MNIKFLKKTFAETQDSRPLFNYKLEVTYKDSTFVLENISSTTTIEQIEHMIINHEQA